MELLFAASSIVALAISLLSLVLSRPKHEAREETREEVPILVSEFTRRVERLENRLVDIQVRFDIMEVQIDRLRPDIVKESTVQVRGTALREAPERMVISHPKINVGSVISQSTSPTEVAILRLILNGEKTPSGIRAAVGKSREHVSRVLKRLHDQGLVSRSDGRPYVYAVTDVGRSFVVSSIG